MIRFGAAFQPDPPASRLIGWTQAAEKAGFDHAWAFDSHILWQEPFVLFSAMLAATDRIAVGPMVTNPITRDPTVLASSFATLNAMFGNRTICGIGRGDSALRFQGRPAGTLAQLRQAVTTIRDLGSSRSATLGDREISLPWSKESDLPVWVAGYGPKAIEVGCALADGIIIQVADPVIIRWYVQLIETLLEKHGRSRESFRICVAAPAYSNTDHTREHAIEQCRWFGAMVGNHIAELVRRHMMPPAGDEPETGAVGITLPDALTDFVHARQEYDYTHHGRSGNPHAAYVSDTVTERFCIIGDQDYQVARVKELADLGVTDLALYLQHDAIDATITTYESVIATIKTRHG